MPFIGQDPRGPGFNWKKSNTSSGWNNFDANKVILEALPKNEVKKLLGAYLQEVLDKKHRNSYTTLTAAPDSKSSVKENTSWIQIGSRGSKEIHGYTTIGELIRRLNFATATINEIRFRYVLRVVEILVFHRLTSLSGSALCHLFDLIEKCLQHVLTTALEIRAMRELLNCLMTSLQRQSRDQLFSSKVIWLQNVARVRHWQKTLNQIQVPRRVDFGLTLSDLPLELQHKIAMSLTHEDDVISLSQVSMSFNYVCQLNSTWEGLCRINFTESQIKDVKSKIESGDVKDISTTEYNQIKWKAIYFALKNIFQPVERDYHNGLLLCRCCSILFWEVSIITYIRFFIYILSKKKSLNIQVFL